MYQLKKTSTTAFHGNGLGTSPACWTIKGYENIAIRQLGTMWCAVDTAKDDAKIATAFDRKTLLLKLQTITF